jgi:formylglycine-generating enzyme required for sulfatase activity
MQTVIPTSDAQRTEYLERYEGGRRRTAQILNLPAPSAYFAAPIPLRHPFVFYDGHIPDYSFITLVRNALGGDAIDERLERLFQRGIDPDDLSSAAASAPDAWPTRDRLAAFTAECDRRVMEALRTAQLEDPNNPHLMNSEAVENIIEHELMHHETLLYIVHQLPAARKQHLAFTHEDRPAPPYRRVKVGAGVATLGARRGELAFGWDNEFACDQVAVRDFEIEVNSVTNGDYLSFVEQGAPAPKFWERVEGLWHLRTQFDLIPLPKSWPVYATHEQASAYAKWKGLRLPTESEYHRAAFGTPQGEERAFPWGAQAPDATRGNFDFARYDPVPVGSYPQGASAWGVNDLIGNGWEWTASLFAPLTGFRPMTTYPVYSSDFFDGKHFIMKGASPVTDRRLVRRSFRNWFRPDYPYVYAKFRCVSV